MRKNWIMFVCFCIILGVSARTVQAQKIKDNELEHVAFIGKVIDEQNQPIFDAKVTLYILQHGENHKEKEEVTTEADGTFYFSIDFKRDDYRYGYIVAQKAGLALGWAHWNMSESRFTLGSGDIKGHERNKKLEIKLKRPNTLAGWVVDENNKPVSKAQVSIYRLHMGQGNNQRKLGYSAAMERFTIHTDDAGHFIFNNLPTGARAAFLIDKAGRAKINTYLIRRTCDYAVGQKDIKLVLPKEAMIEGRVVEKKTGKPLAGIRLMAVTNMGIRSRIPFESDENGKFHIDSLAPGRYILELAHPKEKLADWIADPIEADTEAGKTHSGFVLELSKGGVLEVKVRDAGNKQPVEKAFMSLIRQVDGRDYGIVLDKEGIGRIRLLPGNYRISSLYKQGYLRQEPQVHITIEEGKIKHREFELSKRLKITGIVRDDKGQVVEGVKLKICPSVGNDVSTDVEGRFLMTYDPQWRSTQKDRTLYLVCRHEERNLAAAVPFSEDTHELGITLQPAGIIVGKVEDFNGNRIAHAHIVIMLRGSGWDSSIGFSRITTDKRGNFEVKAVPLGHTYSLYASAEGYAEDRFEKLSAKNALNNRLDVGTLRLAVADLSVSGIVVDTDGKPVPGAFIHGYEEKGQADCHTWADKEGKFTLEGVCVGRIFLTAYSKGVKPLRGSRNAKGGMTNVRIVVRPMSMEPESSQPEPSTPSSLVGKSLPDLKTVGIILAPNDIKNKKLLVCFWDIEQRPSRHLMTQLAKQAAKLKDKGIVVVAVQASKTDEKVIRQWVKENDIPFPVGMTQEETKKTRFTWGIQSLPWLILTDIKLIVIAEGFQLGELDDQLEHMNRK